MAASSQDRSGIISRRVWREPPNKSDSLANLSWLVSPSEPALSCSVFANPLLATRLALGSKRIVMGEEAPKEFKCTSCGAIFQREMDLERHKSVIHTQAYVSKPGDIPRLKRGSRRHRS